ncbi:hypothetical protein B484DRAFT_404619 [Ochromonadaceae sp. CCMP2298]|nr:hypothetical protein B484DRAFT_404619 [Ochromonadaceae sp. CCMP2298]
MFVVAKSLMVTGAKKAGVYDYWTGKEPVDFPCNEPKISMFMDEGWWKIRTPMSGQEEVDLRALCTMQPPDPQDPQGSPGHPAQRLWQTSDYYLTTEDPIYHPRMPTDQDSSVKRERGTGIAFAPACLRTGDVERFMEHCDKITGSLLMYRTEKSKHRSKVVEAQGVLEGCLGQSANAVIKQLLDEDKIPEAWEALQEYYVPHDVDVIHELDKHLRELKLEHPQRLPEYFNLVDLLRSALDDCGVRMGDNEVGSIVKTALLQSAEGKKAFEQTFTNARQNRWDWQHLSMILLEEAHALQQEAGIDYLEKEKIDREVAKRMKQLTPGSGYKAEPYAQTAEGNAANPQPPRQLAGPMVKGTDGKVNDRVKCFRCQQNGHIAKLCPTRVAPNAAKAKEGKGGDSVDTAGANAAEESGSKQAPPASKTNSSEGWAKVGHKGNADTGAAFVIEVDDNFETYDEDVFAADTEVLDLFLPTEGEGGASSEL